MDTVFKLERRFCCVCMSDSKVSGVYYSNDELLMTVSVWIIKNDLLMNVTDCGK